MKKEDYECHITLFGDKKRIEDCVNRVGFGWTFSAIDGDPVLGQHVFCYATNHFESEKDAHVELYLAIRDLVSLGLRSNIKRSKIEHIVFDERYSNV
jgi:hypothetical protein